MTVLLDPAALPRQGVIRPTDLSPRDGIDPDSLSDLLGEIARVREAAFALSDAARDVFGHGHTGVHVHLQTAANELGELERLLHQAHV